MKRSIITLVLIFTLFALQSQSRYVDRTNFRAGINAGPVVGDFSEAFSFGLGVDLYHHWGVSKALDIGVSTGFFNAFGESETISAGGLTTTTEFGNIQYLPVAASFRVYPTSGFKLGGDVGYGVGINEGNQGGLYFRPSLGIDLNRGTSELNISYFSVDDDITFSAVLFGYLFLF